MNYELDPAIYFSSTMDKTLAHKARNPGKILFHARILLINLYLHTMLCTYSNRKT